MSFKIKSFLNIIFIFFLLLSLIGTAVSSNGSDLQNSLTGIGGPENNLPSNSVLTLMFFIFAGLAVVFIIYFILDKI